jgi:hypothetical protein
LLCWLAVTAGNWRNALRDSQEALQLDTSNIKAGMRVGWLPTHRTAPSLESFKASS